GARPAGGQGVHQGLPQGGGQGGDLPCRNQGARRALRRPGRWHPRSLAEHYSRNDVDLNNLEMPMTWRTVLEALAVTAILVLNIAGVPPFATGTLLFLLPLGWLSLRLR